MKDRYGHELAIGDQVMWYIEYYYPSMPSGFRGTIGIVTDISESHIQVDWKDNDVFPVEEYDVYRVTAFIVKVDSPEFTALLLKTGFR